MMGLKKKAGNSDLENLLEQRKNLLLTQHSLLLPRTQHIITQNLDITFTYYKESVRKRKILKLKMFVTMSLVYVHLSISLPSCLYLTP